MLGKGKAWAQDGGVRLNEGVALTLDHGGWNGFALHFHELGLTVKELELAGSARHEQIDYPLGLDGEPHETGLPSCSEGFLGEKGCEGDLADADSAILKKVTARAMEKWRNVHGLVMASSRFMMARARRTFPASSGVAFLSAAISPGLSSPFFRRSIC